MYSEVDDFEATEFWRGYGEALSSLPHTDLPQIFSYTDILEIADSSALPSPAVAPRSPITFLPDVLPPKAEVTPTTTKPASPPLITITHSPISTASAESTVDTTLSLDAPPTRTDAEEDSYWAQYSSVHGTADSTAPSPRLPNGRKPELDEYGRPILSPEHEQQVEEHAGVLEYEPTAVARPDAYLSGTVEDEFGDDGFGRGFDDAFAHGHHPSRDGLGLHVEPEAKQSEESSSPEAVATPSPTQVTVSTNAALEDTIRGLYYLWKNQPGNTGRSADDFLAVVRQAVEPRSVL
ncbi:hypothetical protein FRB99_005234 [Tulasnella sp. 403]|nr:hypothetical protein FRB99_005234 [Tulasnella sp. 403]